jgi:23S rRNA pseudouridine1911/1915/1917 synthase
VNQGYSHRERLRVDRAGVSVLAHLTAQYPHSSEGVWRQRLALGEVKLDGVVARGNEHLRHGQWLVWDRPPWVEPDAPLELRLLHVDRSLVVVAKPAGLPTLPGAGFLEHTLLTQLQRSFPEAAPVHRLGRWTSGVVICPRGREAASAIQRAWGTPRVEKVYRALAAGRIECDSFEISTPIGLIDYAPLGKLHAAVDDGRPAHSVVRILKRRPMATLVEVRITTGRPHQIRIHLAAGGHPLVGDPLYATGGRPRSGCTAVPGDPGYLLHAFRVVLPHPDNGERIEFTDEPPTPLAFV